MSTETKMIGKTLIGFSPAIYLSYGHLGYFSVPGSRPISEKSDEAVLECVEHTTLYGMPSEYYTYTFVTSEQTPQHAVYAFSHSISVIPEVKAVTFQIEDEIIRLWTFISKRDKTVRKSIYMKELDLMDTYSGMVFDFNVVSVRSFSEPFIPQNLHGSLSFYRNINGN